MTREQSLADEQEAAAQRQADRRWESLLKKWKCKLGDKRKRFAAEESLIKVTDPKAAPAVGRIFGRGSLDDQSRAVSILREMQGPLAARELVSLAVFSDSKQIREIAIGFLKQRERREYVGLLISLIQFPIKYRYQPITGPGTQGGLLIETPRFVMLRTYETPAPFSLECSFAGTVMFNGDGMPIPFTGFDMNLILSMNRLEAAKYNLALNARAQQLMNDANMLAAAAQRQLAADVGVIERANNQTAALSGAALPVLQEAAGAPAACTDPDALNKWWNDRLGYSYEPPPQTEMVVDAFPEIPPPVLISCFVAGTPVRTGQGLAPIERIQPGDLVLSQDVTTGALGFRPVLRIHHNPPNRTVRIKLSDNQVVVPSIYHRFWLSGRGWAQARDLKPGDVLRALGGTLQVVSAEPGAAEPVYNLDVADNRSFFVGKSDVLVHDNTLPPARQAAFDVTPDLTQPGKRAD